MRVVREISEGSRRISRRVRSARKFLMSEEKTNRSALLPIESDAKDSNIISHGVAANVAAAGISGFERWPFRADEINPALAPPCEG